MRVRASAGERATRSRPAFSSGCTFRVSVVRSRESTCASAPMLAPASPNIATATSTESCEIWMVRGRNASSRTRLNNRDASRARPAVTERCGHPASRRPRIRLEACDMERGEGPVIVLMHDRANLSDEALDEIYRTGLREGYRAMEYSLFAHWQSSVDAKAVYSRVTAPVTRARDPRRHGSGWSATLNANTNPLEGGHNECAEEARKGSAGVRIAFPAAAHPGERTAEPECSGHRGSSHPSGTRWAARL